MNAVNIKSVTAFIEKHPSATHSEYSNTKGTAPISDCYYYMLRRKVTGMARDTRKKSNTYIRLFLMNASEVNAEAKKLLQKFLDAMNTVHRMKMEIIEFGNPPQLEIRELKSSF